MELQALKQKLTTVQSRLKANAKEPLRPSQQGTEGWPGKEGGVVEIGVDAYSGHPGAAMGRG